MSWNDPDLGIDLLRNINKPVRSVITTDLVPVDCDTALDEILDLLVDGERNINWLPVVDGDELVGTVT